MDWAKRTPNVFHSVNDLAVLILYKFLKSLCKTDMLHYMLQCVIV